MPTEFWYTISDATHDLPYDQGANSGGANKNASVQIGGGRSGPATHDGDTSYVSETSNGQKQAYNTDWPGPVGTVGSTFTFYSRCRGVQGGGAWDSSNMVFAFSDIGGTIGATIHTKVINSATYGDTGPTDVSDGTTYHPNTQVWGPSDFNDDMSLFPMHNSTGLTDDAQRVTSIWGELQYTPPSGGFAFLLNLAGLMALPFVGRMADFAQFSAYLDWRRLYHPRGTIMEPNEVRTAWREYREYRWPTYLEMAA